MSTRILLSTARREFAATVNRVAYKDERVILQRNGKDFVALIPVEDLELLEEIENHIDLAAAQAARREKSVPWEKAKRSLDSRVRKNRIR